MRGMCYICLPGMWIDICNRLDSLTNSFIGLSQPHWMPLSVVYNKFLLSRMLGRQAFQL